MIRLSINLMIALAGLLALTSVVVAGEDRAAKLDRLLRKDAELKAELRALEAEEASIRAEIGRLPSGSPARIHLHGLLVANTGAQSRIANERVRLVNEISRLRSSMPSPVKSPR
jgi:cell division protein FtsB